MNQELILHYLQTYQKDEIFYKAYYEAGKREDTLKAFLKDLDPAEVAEKKRLVPELFPDSIPHYMKDLDYFDLLSSKSVFLSKHNRYTPLFLHRHDFFEVIYVMSGTCRHMVHTQNQLLLTGDLCLLAPSIPHGIWVGDDSIIINILIRRSTIEDIFFHVLRDHSIISSFFVNNMYSKKRDAYLIFHTAGDEMIPSEIINMYTEQFQEDEYSNRIIESMFTIFLNNLIRRYKKTVEYPSNSTVNNEKDFQIINYMLAHYDTVTLEELSAQLHYTLPYCSAYIKKTTGHTFTELLRNIKFQRAEMLLKTTAYSVQKISSLLGYENPENFMRAFKKTYHKTPTQFREGET